MSQQQGSPASFIAGEALEAYRRVKLDTGSGTNVVYADAGEAAIGVTVEKVASGDPVAVRLNKHGGTHKVTAAGSFAVGATLYGANDGKVDDAASGSAIGTALEAATAAGDIVEAVLSDAVSSSIAPANVLNDAANEGAVPILIHKVCEPNSTPDPVTIATATRKLKVARAWMISRDTTAANVTLKNGSDGISAATAKGTADDTLVGFKVIAEYDEIAKDAVISAAFSAQANVDVFLLCIPIA
ncbi:MAG TPA: DUF2190 family protein [Candidatus Sumerlaeota bacterium]|nr:DUF2190 family protein [Candidatus Sumerlaeota bacterium]